MQEVSLDHGGAGARRFENAFLALLGALEQEPTPSAAPPDWLSRAPAPVRATGPLGPAAEPEVAAEPPPTPVARATRRTILPAPPTLVIERLPDGAVAAEQAAALRAELAEARAALAAGAVTRATLRREILASSEPDLVELAQAIAERVLGREPRADPERVSRWAREGLVALGAHGRPVVALSAVVDALDECAA